MSCGVPWAMRERTMRRFGTLALLSGVASVGGSAKVDAQSSTVPNSALFAGLGGSYDASSYFAPFGNSSGTEAGTLSGTSSGKVTTQAFIVTINARFDRCGAAAGSSHLIARAVDYRLAVLARTDRRNKANSVPPVAAPRM